MNTNNRIVELARGFERNSGASEFEIAEIEKRIGVLLPPDYREFLRQSNGAEGQIGRSGYLQLWAVEEIPKLNTIARVSEFASGLVLFGSDGGSMSYAFDTRQPSDVQFVEVSDFAMALDEIKIMGHTFVQFLEALASQF